MVACVGIELCVCAFMQAIINMRATLRSIKTIFMSNQSREKFPQLYEASRRSEGHKLLSAFRRLILKLLTNLY